MSLSAPTKGLAGLALIAATTTAFLRLDATAVTPSDGRLCVDEVGACEVAEYSGAALPPAATESEFCHDVGYLCAGLAGSDSVPLLRWPGDTGTMVVHVPLPDLEDGSAARALQRAAAQGIRAWNDHPFPILADLRGDRDPHFTVRWKGGLGSGRLGVAHLKWSPATGLRVGSIDLALRSPWSPSNVVDPSSVRLTAAHEMGHALGLGHSDAPRDVMYPSNTATSMSAQDYRSVEVLYRTADGTVVRR